MEAHADGPGYRSVSAPDPAAPPRAGRGPRPPRWWVRPLLLVLLVTAGTVTVLALGVPSVEELRERVASAGWVGPLVFVVVYALLTLTAAPAAVLSIAAGLLFGLGGGLAVVMAGALLSAVGAFVLARLLGRDAVARVDSDRLRGLDAMVRRRGLLAVTGVRLVPVLPFAALNYACGLTAVRARDYVLGTAVGILPGATAYVAAGAYGTEPGSAPFLLALAGLAVLTVAGIVVGRRRRSRGEVC